MEACNHTGKGPGHCVDVFRPLRGHCVVCAQAIAWFVLMPLRGLYSCHCVVCTQAIAWFVLRPLRGLYSGHCMVPITVEACNDTTQFRACSSTVQVEVEAIAWICTYLQRISTAVGTQGDHGGATQRAHGFVPKQGPPIEDWLITQQQARPWLAQVVAVHSHSHLSERVGLRYKLNEFLCARINEAIQHMKDKRSIGFSMTEPKVERLEFVMMARKATIRVP
eukprot:1144964-Pelagomonas_calceolata.AAC.4